MMIHKNLEDLHKHVPKSILPKEYGGDLGPLSDLIASWAEKVRSKRDFLLDDMQYGIDESKRRTPSKVADFIGAGADGSFRKLIAE
jgi:hypothetical protein